jgi:hypothetical protein
MEISKIQLPKKSICSKKTDHVSCEADSQCMWNSINEKCIVNNRGSLFNEYIRVVRSHSGRETIEIIAKKLRVSYEGRSIEQICNDIQQLIHVAMHGNTIATIAKKLDLSTKKLKEGDIYYAIYRHIFDKLEESNQKDKTHSTPGYINFKRDKVIYKNEYNYTDRINYANRVNNILQKQPKGSFCEFKKGFEKIKRIGSKSIFGEAFIAYNSESKDPLYTALKLMPKNDSNTYEVEMYKVFQSYVTNKLSPHFPMIYTSHICNTCQYDNKRHFRGKCISLLNELAEGDLKTYLKQPHTSYDLIIIYGQLIMACLAMEHAGYVHHDLHWGNFLYHTVPEYKGKYMHYVYYDEYYKKHTVYLKNNGTVFIAWDFGKMTEQHGMVDNVYYDIYRIFHINRWALDEGYPQFPLQANTICTQLKNATSTARSVEDMIKKYNTFLHEQKNKKIQDIILFDPLTPPPANKIINSIAYELPI